MRVGAELDGDQRFKGVVYTKLTYQVHDDEARELAATIPTKLILASLLVRLGKLVCFCSFCTVQIKGFYHPSSLDSRDMQS
jgi:hypothetical protein